MKLFINLDFHSGDELSHYEVKQFFRYNKISHRYVYTCDLSFCDFQYLNYFEDIIVVNSDNKFLSLKELLKDSSKFGAKKEIRKEHKIIKLLLNDYFTFVSDLDEE